MDALSRLRDQICGERRSARGWTATSPSTVPTRRCDRAVEHLLSLQDPDGWWKGELETNVTMDAEDMLLREFLGIREPAHDGALRRLDPLAAAR